MTLEFAGDDSGARGRMTAEFAGEDGAQIGRIGNVLPAKHASSILP